MPKGRPNTMNNYGVGEAPPSRHKEAGTSVWGDLFPAQTFSEPWSPHLSDEIRQYYEVKHTDDVCTALSTVLSEGLPQGPRDRPYQLPC